MNSVNLPLLLAAGLLVIYFIWKMLSPAAKNKGGQKRFSIRKHRKRYQPDELDEEEE